MVKLPQYSWYGDFPIILEIPSTFQLEASIKGIAKNKEQKVKVYKLEANKLRELLDAYPEWKKFVIARAVNRRAYFMTIRDDFRNCHLLTQKTKVEKLTL